MKRYMFVIELKPEHVKEYVEIHKNPWPEILQEIKNAGAKELLLSLSVYFTIPTQKRQI